MTDQTALAPASTSRLEPNAISVAQDTLIGLADCRSDRLVSFSLVALIAATAYGAPIVLAITAIPMLIIANAYRRLNLWNANCGASFEWVGRAINPYLGYMTGWLMLAGTLFGTLTPVTALGPSVLSVFNQQANGKWPNIAIATGLVLVMMTISIVGIRITARTQVVIGVVEYLILIAFAIWGLTWVLGHHAGTSAFSASWFSLQGPRWRGQPGRSIPDHGVHVHAAGTAPSTSTRKSSTGGKILAGPRCWPWPSPACSSYSRRLACRAWRHYNKLSANSTSVLVSTSVTC